MPYSYHKQGNKYFVTKKDTGKEVGRTKGTKEALNKYLAALHINANENKTMKKSELTKMIQEVIKEVLSEQSTKKITEAEKSSMFVTGGSINPELRKKVEQFVKGVAKYYDYSVDDALLAIMTILKGGLNKMNETDYMNRRKKQDADYTTNKKDAPKKQSKMSMPTGKTDYMKRREAEKKMQEAAPAKAKDLGLSDKGYWRFEFPKDKQGKSTRETAIRDIKSTLDKDQKTYPELKIDIMPLKKEEDKEFAVIKLNGEGAHTVGLKMKAAYKDKAGFKGAVIKPYHPTFQSK